jgi:hypothetical protein
VQHPSKKEIQMKSQKDSLVTLSKAQANPYLCDPNLWEIIRDDDEAFHGQMSDKLLKQADAECGRRPPKRTTATEPGNASPSKRDASKAARR